MFNFYNKLMIFITLFLSSFWCRGATLGEAQVRADATFDYVATTVDKFVKGWNGPMTKAATYLLFALAAIAFILEIAKEVIGSSSNLDLGTIMMFIIKYFLVIGFFYWLIKDSPTVLATLLGEFGSFANKVGGVSGDAVTPSKFVSNGWTMMGNLWTYLMANAKGMEFFLGMLTCIVSWLLFVVTGFNMMLTQISFYFVLYGGLFILGFGAFNQTRDFAVKYLKSLAGISITYYGMILMCHVSVQLLTLVTFDSFPAAIDMYFCMITSVIASFMLINQLPPALGAIMSGNAHVAQFSAVKAAGMAVAAAAFTLVGTAKVAGHAAGGLKAMAQGAKSAYQSARNAAAKVDEKTNQAEQMAADKVNMDARS